MSVAAFAPSATPNEPAETPYLTPPLMPWTGSPLAATHTPLTAEQMEAIVQRAEAEARAYRTRRIIARLDALRPCPHVHVPADWREQAAATTPCNGGDA